MGWALVIIYNYFAQLIEGFSEFTTINVGLRQLKVSENSLCANLVIDGVIMENNLKAIGKDKNWLIKRLEKEGYKTVDDILLVLCDPKEKLTIYPMNFRVGKAMLE